MTAPYFPTRESDGNEWYVGTMLDARALRAAKAAAKQQRESQIPEPEAEEETENDGGQPF